MGDGKSALVSPQVVEHVAELANIPTSEGEREKLASAFSETLAEVDHIFSVDTAGVMPTHHVTGLVNIWREDRVDESRILSQKVALSQAAKVHKGYVVVDRILEEEHVG